MQYSISIAQKSAILNPLSAANQAFNAIYKGDRPDRQPIHTVYQGADLFRSDVISTFGAEALDAFLTYAPDWITFGKAFQLNGFEQLPQNVTEINTLIREYEILKHEDLKNQPFGFMFTIYQKVIAKLQSEPIEDYRIDFEDGFGNKTDQQEDETAVFVALELAKAMQQNTLPYFMGIRTKSFTEELKERSVRTIDLLLTSLLTATNGLLPNNFVIMLPKVTIPEQVTALCAFLDLIEAHFHLPKNAIKIEMMVETTQAVMDIHGTNPLYRFIQASNGRCHAMHFGTYDYTASCGITAAYQEMDHPVCDFAHHITKVALAHTGIWLSDGATNTLPKGPHSGSLTQNEWAENQIAVHAAWLKGYRNIRHSLWNGFYQGWDLFAAQLPMRYTAIYAFFLESYPDAVRRMQSFLQKTAPIHNSKNQVDIAEDAATGQALLNYFLKAINSGAISLEEATVTGLTEAEIASRSFANILKNRMYQ
jgi:citrate lyase beta subunit